MNTTANATIDQFNDCWIKALLYHVLTKEDILTITRRFGAVSAKNENKISRNGLVELIFFRVAREDLISALHSIVKEKGIPDLYSYLESMHGKITMLEPIQVADIYLHLPNHAHKDMAMKVFSGEDLQNVFKHELITLMFKELLSDNEKTLVEMFEYSVAKNHAAHIRS